MLQSNIHGIPPIRVSYFYTTKSIQMGRNEYKEGVIFEGERRRVECSIYGLGSMILNSH